MKQQQDLVRQKVKDWVQIGYHAHVVQAFKVQITQGRALIFLQKIRSRTLRDWIACDFFVDKNKHLNSKRMLNCVLQIAVGLNYIHKRRQIHQCLIPDHIFVQQDKILKISNLCSINLLTNRLGKNSLAGGSPQYWSPQQNNIYQTANQSFSQGNYQNALRLLPSITFASDIYQLGLIILQLLFGRRNWIRGDQIDFNKFKDLETNATKDTTIFLLQKCSDMLQIKPQKRLSLKDLIVPLLQFYSKQFKNAQDLLWVKFFNEEKYQSDLLNNKAVGLFLSGNETDCQKAWYKSTSSNPCNLTAVYNYNHFKRMKRQIDDRMLTKQLILLPQTRKRNYYLLISNLVLIPLLKQPFKTYNFSPKLSKNKQIQTIANIIQGLQKIKKPTNYCYQRRYHLTGHVFYQCHILFPGTYFIGRLVATNTFRIFDISIDVKHYAYVQFGPNKQPASAQNRQSLSVVDQTAKYLAFSQNSSLWIFLVSEPQNPKLHLQIKDYGSGITTMCFDQKSEVLGIGSNQFTVKLIELSSKNIYKTINVGQKFIIRNLQYYDRNTCIGYSYEKSLSFHRIQTAKQLFVIRSNATVINYCILQASLSSHVMIVHTVDKFQIWNLKDKILIRNIEIDQAPKIQGFFANSSKKLAIHFTANVIRIWNYSNGLVLKTYRTPIPLIWIHSDSQFKTLRCLDIEGNLITRNIDFSDFIKHFEGICVPNQICASEDPQTHPQSIKEYVNYGRQLILSLNQYRINEQQKKISLDKMYKIAETVKTTMFFQDKVDLKAVFLFLNGIRQKQDRTSRINAHSEQYIFTSRQQQFITAVSTPCDGCWLLGDSQGNVRLVSFPTKIHLTIKPKAAAVSFLSLQSTTIFIGYNSSCLLLQRDSIKIVVNHAAYHKKPLRMGLIVNNIFITADQDQIVLFWNKEKVKRYQIPVYSGQCIGKKLIIAGYDNRIRLYQVDSQNGLVKIHVFIGHVMTVYRIHVIDQSVFASSSFDGTVRWWNIQAKTCYSYYNFRKYLPVDKILYVDLPRFSLEEQKKARFDVQGCALLLVNHSEVVVFDTMRKQIKWRYQFPEDVSKVYWTDYPNAFVAVTHQQAIAIQIYWRYMVLKN